MLYVRMYPYVIPHHNVCNHISSIILCVTVIHSLHCLEAYSPMSTLLRTYTYIHTYVRTYMYVRIICSVYIRMYTWCTYFTVIRTFAGARYFVLFSGSQYKELQPLVMVRLLYVYRHTVHVRSCIGTYIYTCTCKTHMVLLFVLMVCVRYVSTTM